MLSFEVVSYNFFLNMAATALSVSVRNPGPVITINDHWSVLVYKYSPSALLQYKPGHSVIHHNSPPSSSANIIINVVYLFQSECLNWKKIKTNTLIYFSIALISSVST